MFTSRTRLRHGRKLARGALALALLAGSASAAGCAELEPSEEGELDLAGETEALASNKENGSAFVEVSIARMVAQQLTPETGMDEIFMVVSGQTPHMSIDERLPLSNREDYYRFDTNYVRTDSSPWDNQDLIDQGPPLIWNGRLWPGESAAFQVMVMEQDNAQLGDIKAATKAICKFGESASDPYVKAAAVACGAISELIPVRTDGELVGAFSIYVKNEGGDLKTVVAPLVGAEHLDFGDAGESFRRMQEENGRALGDLVLNGKGRYRVQPLVKTVDTLRPRLKYMNRTEDNCGDDFVHVEKLGGGHLSLPRGGWGETPIHGHDFNWLCGTSRERTVCDAGSDYVRLWRDPNGREIVWGCFDHDPILNDHPGEPLPAPDASAQKLRIERWITRTGGYWEGQQFFAGDFNGDSYTDIAKVWKEANNSLTVEVYRSFGNHFQLQRWATGLGYTGNPRLVAGDFNGDGRSDIASLTPRLDGGASGATDIAILFSNGQAFELRHWNGSGPATVGDKWMAGDFDGDGRDDLAAVRNDGGQATIVTALSRGLHFEVRTMAHRQLGFWAGQNHFPGDFNGDGKTDIGLVWGDHNGEANMHVYESRGWYFEPRFFAGPQTGFWGQQKWFAGDFNVDGKDDMGKAFGEWNNQWLEISMDMHLSNGSTFTPQRWVTRQGGYGDQQRYLVGDYNGDGSDDVAMVGDEAGAVTIDVHANKQRAYTFFKRIGGNVRDLGITGTGTVWALGTRGIDPAHDSRIYVRENDAWREVGGLARRIDGGPTGPWVVNTHDDLFKWENDTWVQQTDVKARDVGVAEDGTVWVVSNEAQWGGHRIYRKRPGGTYEYMHAAGARIDAGPNGSAWMVNEYDQIYAFDAATGWQQIEGAAKDVTVSPQGVVYVAGLAPEAHGGTIYRRIGNRWERVPSYGAVALSAGPSGQLVAMSKEGEVFAYEGWQLVRLLGYDRLADYMRLPQ